MRVHARLGFDQIDELCRPVGDWEVVGPTGQYYGRYKTRPHPSQLPPYAMARPLHPRDDVMTFGPGGPQIRLAPRPSLLRT